MKKNFLILVSILALESTSYAESTSELPPLPTQNIVITESTTENKSFWNKFLDFIGLGEKEAIVKNDIQPKEQAITPQDNEINSANQVDINKPVELRNTNTSIPVATLPISQTTSNQTNTTSTPTDLKLPEGFDIDEAANKKESQINTEPSSSKSDQDKSLALPEELPSTQDEPEKEQPAQEPSVELLIPQVPESETLAPEDTDKNNIVESLQKQNEPEKELTSSEPTVELLIPQVPKSETLALKEDTTKNITEEKQQKTDSEVSKYRKQLQERLSQPKKLPEIPKEEIGRVADHINTDNIDDIQSKFINDEAQVLTLRGEDIILGEITEEARMDLIDFSSYVPIFWNNYNLIKNESARKEIDNFIADYDSKFNSHSKKENTTALIEAFEAIDKNNIYDLINLVDNYSILQMVDQNKNNLLHKAVYKRNYPAAKFLLMKGINLAARTNQGDTALDIAISTNNPDIITLLNSAGASPSFK